MKLKNKVASIVASGVIVGAQYFADNKMAGCDIKGNISVTSGERIYHLPLQDYYDETRIDFSKGERWFCSESEARSVVGRAVRSAAFLCLATIKKRGSDPLMLSEWQATMVLAQKIYVQKYDDIDGFGIGTIGEIQKGFEKIAEKYGAETLISPNILAGM